ncbi:MAG TPA: hypothetical protein VGD60_14050 [Candidatus Acidoferrales bacterium]
MKFLAILLSFLHSPEMTVVERIGNWNEFFVPSGVPRLVAAEEQNRAAAWIESKKHPIRLARVLDSQFLHILVTRRVNYVRMRPGQARAKVLEQDHLGVDVDLFRCSQGVPSTIKFIGEFNFPFHEENIA